MSTFNPYDHFGFLTNRVARLISKSMHHLLEKDAHCFPPSCIGILADLWAKDGVNQKDLGISLIKTKSSINKMLTALEEEGLIEKREDPKDGRGKLIFLTKEGRAMQQTIEQKEKQLEEILLSDYTIEDIETTKKVLAEMYEKLYKNANGDSPHLIVDSKSN